MSLKKRLAISVHIVVPVIVIVFLMGQGEREKPYQAIFSLSPDSHYVVREYAAKEFSIAQKGQLGKMHQCLTQYRSGRDKRAPKLETGPSGSMELKVESYEIYFGIHKGEVTSTAITKYKSDGSYDYGSSPVAVNCNVTLLNQFD
ncbi:hypothetical protein MHN79_16055 [Vibrio sp. Of14-4]|uniref:hypothetical protein n=1 Tax=Vibrio sp. Of14-4 TaxID=2724878 RepID=UPI001EF2E5CF|nr:hypothetical protein [Vibrio sp. Of14-4]MCG7491006.1 hypothetical protein [Vibrio sp. Of14-4]